MGACPLQSHAAQHPAVLAHQTGALPVAYGPLLAPALALCPTQVRMVPSRPGIAFVEYSDEVQAGLALQGLQGFKLATGEAARRDVHPRHCEAALLHSVICGAAGPGGCTNDLLCLGLEEGWAGGGLGEDCRGAGGLAVLRAAAGVCVRCGSQTSSVHRTRARPLLCCSVGCAGCPANQRLPFPPVQTSPCPSRMQRHEHTAPTCPPANSSSSSLPRRLAQQRPAAGGVALSWPPPSPGALALHSAALPILPVLPSPVAPVLPCTLQQGPSLFSLHTPCLASSHDRTLLTIVSSKLH